MVYTSDIEYNKIYPLGLQIPINTEYIATYHTEYAEKKRRKREEIIAEIERRSTGYNV